MKIVVDDKSGFCNGVVKAIEKTEEGLSKGTTVYSLGDLMHNKIEMNRLHKMGLKSVSHSTIEQLEGSTVVIRAHGEPPTTYKRCENAKITIIDATCPVVASLQRIVYSAHSKMRSINGQVVILGKHGHPEVIGLLGQISDNSGIVVESLEEIKQNIDFNRPIYFLSQTTKSLTLFNSAKEYITAQYTDKPACYCTIKDTICRQVSNRQPHLEQFAKDYDVVVFVSGAESSNGKALYSNCLAVNNRCYKVEDESQIDVTWFADCKSVGICGATSTPKWLMDQVATAIKEMVIL